MEFDLTETQRMMQHAARTFLTKECPVERVRKLMATDTALDEALWSKMAEQGWTGMTLPEAVGGLELGLVELAAVAEEMGRACLPGPFISNAWAATLIDKAGDEAARQRYLPGMAAGTLKGTVALLEAAGNWDPASTAATAVASSAGVKLDGCKSLVPDAAVADVIVCVARGSDGLCLACVPSETAAAGLKARQAMDATRKLYDLKLSGCQAEPLASGPQAVEAVDYATRVATVAACAELVGVMQWMLDTAVEYAKTRKQFGRLIGSFQAVQHQCADMLFYLESSRSATYYAAWALSEGDAAAARAVSIAKAYCSDAGREVGNRAVQVHGGIGFTWEHDLHLYYKRAKALEILFGDAEYHRERLARLVVDAA